jgi:hypothetical protein
MIYIDYKIDLPDDGMKGYMLITPSYGGDRQYMQCRSCSFSVGVFCQDYKSFWKFHLRDKPECSENREVITFITPYIRAEEKMLEDYEDVQIS